MNGEVYLDVLKDKVLPWMMQIAGDRPFTFQQDGAPAHTSARVQDWCAQNLPNFIDKQSWPPLVAGSQPSRLLPMERFGI